MKGYAKIIVTDEMRKKATDLFSCIQAEYDSFNKEPFKKKVFGITYGFDYELANKELKHCSIERFFGSPCTFKPNYYYTLDHLIVLLKGEEIYLDSEMSAFLYKVESTESG